MIVISTVSVKVILFAAQIIALEKGLKPAMIVVKRLLRKRMDIVSLKYGIYY